MTLSLPRKVAPIPPLSQHRRDAELEARGYVFVGKGKISANALCPCKSGMKFKRCCVSRVVRFGGGTFVKGVADLTGLPQVQER